MDDITSRIEKELFRFGADIVGFGDINDLPGNIRSGMPIGISVAVLYPKEIIDFCLAFPATYEDYPFDNITDPGKWTVMRHKTNKKSFTMIYEWHGKLCVNLKCDP